MELKGKSIQINYIHIFFKLTFLVMIIQKCITYPLCNTFTNCYSCNVCGLESDFEACTCIWKENECQDSILTSRTNSWRDVIFECNKTSPLNSYYLTLDSFKDGELFLDIPSDVALDPNSNFTYLTFDYYDTQYSDYYIKIVFQKNGESGKRKPFLAKGFMYREDSKSVMNRKRDKEEEITNDYEVKLEKIYNIYFLILIRDTYGSSPFSIYLQTNAQSKLAYVISSLITFAILIIIITIICCITNYMNRKARKQLRELLAIRARENMERIMREEQTIVVREDEKERNLSCLKKLFETTMVEHQYKTEYNKYGGGCSICLDTFNKKSKVSKTPCNHVFHYKCIKDWLFKNARIPKCPNCNFEVLKSPEEQHVGTSGNNNGNNVIQNHNIEPQSIQIKRGSNQIMNQNEVSQSRNPIREISNIREVIPISDSVNRNMIGKKGKGKRKSNKKEKKEYNKNINNQIQQVNINESPDNNNINNIVNDNF